jgi:hypothetical protein
MGYRSDVKIAFYLTQGCVYDPDTDRPAPPSEDNPILPFAALKVWFDETYPVQEAKEEWGATIDYGSDHILVSYHDVKWYDGYEHPNSVSSAFEMFSAAFRSDERDHRGQYEMVRIGEEYDDIQLEGSSYNDHRIAVERSMIFE